MKTANKMVKDIFGKALMDFQSGDYSNDIITYSSLEEHDIMALPYLFRDYKNMPEIEQVALDHCNGEVLDIGAGAGCHSLYLQNNGFKVTALDHSPGAVEVCRKRGIESVVCADFMGYNERKFDTLLLLMNGIGITGNLEKLKEFLHYSRKLLKENGFMLLDSSDIIYMYETENGAIETEDIHHYYGEVSFQIEYKGEKSDFFEWLYIDFDTLCTIAKEGGFACDLLVTGEHYDYLAKLYPTT